MFTGGKLWWADEESAQIGTVTKRDGKNFVALRNKTAGVVHMKVYDKEGQKGLLAHIKQNKSTAIHINTHVTDSWYLNVSPLLVVLNIQEETRAR